jgi:hypothetical protein
MSTRREFLRSGLGTAAALALGRRAGAATRTLPRRRSAVAEALVAGDPDTRRLLRSTTPPRRRPASVPRPLAERFSDLPRHFVFEYYPWYGTDPWKHWDQWDRVPPHDLAANYVPRLGAYDSLSPAVLEQHARWIVETGVGAINLSWWGRDSGEDRMVPLVLDVMKDHGLKVTFHLEPYADDHGYRFADDVLYLLREYGERRRWDTFLLLRDENGDVGPVFKGFRTILPTETRDCHGTVRPLEDYTPDAVFARQFEGLRRTLRGTFDRVTLLADSLNFGRTPRAGFDGIAIYDNFVAPASYEAAAAGATEAGLVFSFNVNPGYDTMEPRIIPPGSCYEPTPFAPTADALDWSSAESRERAASLSAARITESAQATLAVQTDAALSNAAAGFFLVYVNSFNEWHEGHSFEPMKDAVELSPEERRFGYHNPDRGDYRLAHLRELLRPVLRPVAATAAVPA